MTESKVMVFKKTYYDSNSKIIKFKQKNKNMPSTGELLEIYENKNEKYLDEKKNENNVNFLSSKKLEKHLLIKLTQPIIAPNKRIIKFKKKKLPFMPTNLTTIYEDVHY